MFLAAAADYSLLLAAVPTSIATIVAARYALLATRHAAPAVQDADKLEPRLGDVEKVVTGWSQILDAKDEQIAFWKKDSDTAHQEAAHERAVAEQFAQKADRMETSYKDALSTIEHLQLQLDGILHPPVAPPVAE